MRRAPDSFEATVSAFRDLTAAPAEGAATRARVLARAERDARRRSLPRRSVASLVVVLASLLSGAALTAAGFHWRAPAPVILAAPTDEPAAAARPRGSTLIVPSVRDEGPPARAAGVSAGEALAYERAHRAHFFESAPERALAAWDAYLAAYPRGTFAPEARYNRALCLARLGRFAAAGEALRPFAVGRFAGYRRREACTLLRWLSERDARVVAAPDCPDGR
ncbi:MAG TPA: hypothetical protein VIF57_18820 [Polyangia bacterium]|jgi:hypothetical protein